MEEKLKRNRTAQYFVVYKDETLVFERKTEARSFIESNYLSRKELPEYVIRGNELKISVNDQVSF